MDHLKLIEEIKTLAVQEVWASPWYERNHARTLDMYVGSETIALRVQLLESIDGSHVHRSRLISNALSGVKAAQTLTTTGVFSDTEAVVVGRHTYTIQAVLTAGAYHVKLGASTQITLANLAAAINGGAGEGTLYGVGTTAHEGVTATSDATHLVVTAISPGVALNSLVTTETCANASWGAGTLAGGTEAAGTHGLYSVSMPWIKIVIMNVITGLPASDVAVEAYLSKDWMIDA